MTKKVETLPVGPEWAGPFREMLGRLVGEVAAAVPEAGCSHVVWGYPSRQSALRDLAAPAAEQWQCGLLSFRGADVELQLKPSQTPFGGRFLPPAAPPLSEHVMFSIAHWFGEALFLPEDPAGLSALLGRCCGLLCTRPEPRRGAVLVCGLSRVMPLSVVTARSLCYELMAVSFAATQEFRSLLCTARTGRG